MIFEHVINLPPRFIVLQVYLRQYYTTQYYIIRRYAEQYYFPNALSRILNSVKELQPDVVYTMNAVFTIYNSNAQYLEHVDLHTCLIYNLQQTGFA